MSITAINTTNSQLATKESMILAIDSFAIAPELLQRIDEIINRMTKRFNDDAELTCFCKKHLTIDEYNKTINDIEQALNTGHEQPDLLEKELYYFKRDKQKLVEFNNKIEQKRLELLNSYSHPIDSGVNHVIQSINQYLALCLDNIYESFVNKVKLLCPNTTKYEQEINSIYVNGSSKKVINLLNDYTNMIIDGFTKLLSMNNNENSISTDLNKFDNFTKFYKKIESICYNIYDMIYEDINEKIEQYPSHQMSSIKLVRVYAETLLSNIHDHIVNNVSKLVKNKIVNGIEKLAQLGYITKCYLRSNITKYFQRNIEMNNQTVDGNSSNNDNNFDSTVKIEEIETETANSVPKIEYIDNQQSCLELTHNIIDNFDTKTFDSFIDTLNINETYNINTLQTLYNNYFNTNSSTNKTLCDISTQKLSKMISQCTKITKSRKMVDNKKITVYMITKSTCA